MAIGLKERMIGGRGALWAGVMLVAWGLGGCEILRLPEGKGQMEVRVDGVVAAGRPVMMMVTVRNTGKEALTYWNGGPGEFPAGREFVVTVRGESGEEKPVVASNGEYQMGTGRSLGIPPKVGQGGSVEVPLALPPMGAGRYWVTLKGARWGLTPATVEIEVPAREKAVKEFDAEEVRRMEAGDLLAEHVAEKWPREVVQKRLLEDVQSQDAAAAKRALRIFSRGRTWVIDEGGMRLTPLPAGTTEAVTRAINQWAAAGEDETLAVALGNFVASTKLEDAAPALIPIMERLPTGQGRMAVVRGIAVSQSAEATAALHQWLGSGDPWTRFAAASALARRHDVAAVPVLLELTKVRVGRTGDSIYELSYFPDVPEVVAALKGMKGDPAFAEDAKRALKHMEEVKKGGAV